MNRAAPLIAPALLMLAGCGLQPLYSSTGNRAVAHGLADVEVSGIPGRAGWLMHNALTDRLGRSRLEQGGEHLRYRLDVRLDDRLEGLGLLSNNTVGRERRALRARYQLVDSASGAVLLDATAGSDAGIDVVGSEYATVAAEQTALENLTQVVADRIIVQLAAQLHSAPAQSDQPPPKPAR